MKKPLTITIVVIVVIVILILLGPFYILKEGEQAVVTRFGRIVASTNTAGLKIKMPMVDTVVRYSNKILSWDGEARKIPSKENQFIWVDTTARWKIVDIDKFYEALKTMESAYGKLDQIIDSAVRTVIADNLLREAVRNSNIINEIQRNTLLEEGATDMENLEGLAELATGNVVYERIDAGREILSQQMLTSVQPKTEAFGIKVIDIIIRQIRYSDDLTESVYDRMIKERNQRAQAFRSYGEGKKAEWLGKLDNDRRKILSEAYRRAEEIKGRADAEAARIYAEAYAQDAEFFEFWRAIESYRKTLPAFNKTLTTDMEYFRYLYDMYGRTR